MNESEKRELIDQVAESFESLCNNHFNKRIHSLYIVGSYAFNKVSLDRPDINFLIILKGRTTSNDYLILGELCHKIIKNFQDKCSVKIEFRPFRYIYSKIKRDYDVFLNPIIQSVDEINSIGHIFTKWFTIGLKNANKLLSGQDFLKTLNISTITKQDIFQGAIFDLSFFTIPLARAPAQYSEDEYDLLFNEALINGKMMCYLGIEIVMTEEELAKQEFTNYIKNKETIAEFYKTRYGEREANLVKKIFDARENYLTYKNDTAKAKEIFDIALQIGGIIQNKLFSGA